MSSTAKIDQILSLIRGVDDKLSSLSQRVTNVEKLVTTNKESNNYIKDAQNWISAHTKEYRQNTLTQVKYTFEFHTKRHS